MIQSLMTAAQATLQTRASMAAQIKTQAVTIGELSELVAKQDGEIKAQRCHIRQVEGQLGTAHDCQNRLAAKVAKQAAELDKYRPVRGDDGKWTSKRGAAHATTSAGDTANA